MFLFIAGLQPKNIRLSDSPRNCPDCGYVKLFHTRQDQYFSLFFIPLFRVKKGVEILKCEKCGAVSEPNKLRSDNKTPGSCSACRKPVAADFLYCPYCRTPL